MKDIRCLFKHKYEKIQARLISGNDCYGCTRCGTYIIQNSIGSYELTPEDLLVEMERGKRYHGILARQESAQEEFEFLVHLRRVQPDEYDTRQMVHLKERVRELQGLMNELTTEILREVNKEGIKWKT